MTPTEKHTNHMVILREHTEKEQYTPNKLSQGVPIIQLLNTMMGVLILISMSCVKAMNNTI